MLNSAGSASTTYGYTGEWTDNTGMVYLRARYYDPTIARFMTRDTWGGNISQPMSYNGWLYVYANPVIFTDPSGLCARGDQPCLVAAQQLFHEYGWMLKGKWQLTEVNTILDAAQQISIFFNEHGGNGSARMRGMISPAWFSHANLFWLLKGYHHVEGLTVYLLPGFDDETIIHESAHVLDDLYGDNVYAAIRGGGASDKMVEYLGIDPILCFWRFNCPNYISYIYSAKAELPPTHDGDEYARRGPSEDFAVTFMMSIKHTDTMMNDYPIRWKWLTDFIKSDTRVRGPYKGYPYQYLWFLPQPIPVPTCSVPQPITTPEP